MEKSLWIMRLKIPLKAPIHALNKCHASVVTVYWPPAKTGNLASLSQGSAALQDAIHMSLQNVLSEYYKRVHAFSLLEDSRFVVEAQKKATSFHERENNVLINTTWKSSWKPLARSDFLYRAGNACRRIQATFEIQQDFTPPAKTRELHRILCAELESRAVI